MCTLSSTVSNKTVHIHFHQVTLPPATATKFSLLIIFILSISSSLLAQPLISGFSPASGPVGSIVTISGAGFSAIPADNFVRFGATTAKVISTSPISITVIVPAGSTFELISVTTGKLTAYSKMPFLVTIGGDCDMSTSTFSIASTLNTGTYPRHITTTDIDGDGKPDLVVANHMGNGFAVFRNTGGNGNLSFASPNDFSSGTQPFATATGDLDGDGKMEVITHSYPDNTIHIFKNLSTPGVISFDTKIVLAAGTNPQFVSIADIDKDGKPDVIAVNNNANSVSVFRNVTNGNIAMANKIDFPVGQWPGNIFVADLDGDGYPDIAASNFQDNTVSVLRNMSTNGLIAFDRKKDFITESKPFWVTAGDLDLDGKPEMIVANSGSASVSIFKNNTTPGNISFNKAINVATGNSPLYVALANVNGNSKPDLVVVNFVSSNVAIIPNKSLLNNLIFDAPAYFATGMLPRAVAIADFDGDNKPDLSVVNSTENTISILQNKVIKLDFETTTVSTKCSGSNGSITVNASGGYPPYEYSLNNLPYQSSSVFSDRPNGSYLIRVKDAGGCVANKMVNLEGNGFLSYTLTITAANCGDNNGTLTIIANGNRPPFFYSINGIDYQTSGEFKNLPAGIYNAYLKDSDGCTTRQGFSVSSGCITVTTTAKDATCKKANGSITVQASGGNVPYRFSIDGLNFQPGNSFTNLKAGSYTITVKDGNGITKTVVVPVADVEGPALVIQSASATDCSNATGVIQLQATGGSGQLKYSIDGTNFLNTPRFGGLASGNYTAIAVDANGCQATATTSISLINTLQVDAGRDTTICEGDHVLLKAVSNGNKFQWSPTTSLTNAVILQPAVSPSATTTYTLTAANGGCTTSDAVTISVHKAPVANAGNDVSVCLGSDAQLKATEGPFTYSWAPDRYLDQTNASATTVRRPPAGIHIYQLNVTDANGCRSLKPDEVTVSVTALKVFAGNDTLGVIGERLRLFVADVDNSGQFSVNWSPATGLDNAGSRTPVATLQNDITYQVTARTPDGCEGTDNIFIKVFRGPEIYVPNAFTPNGDGKHDVLKAIPVGIKTFRRLLIYNRWGQLVFSTTEPSKGWNGTLNGQPQKGSFVWLAEGTDFRGHHILRKGITTIIY